MTKQYHVFISSKMVELAAERQALQDLLPRLGNDLVQLKAWVFEEDAPASNKTIREIYLDALKSSPLYIGLFWNEYGEWTVDEFQKATEWGIDRHIYVKNVNPEARDPRLEAFLNAQSDVITGITPKWFTTLDELKEQVARSLQVWLQDHLQKRPGDTAAIRAEFSDDIPDLPQRLIGRNAELDKARQYLDEGSRVLLQGFGGTGKTAIAATLAADWLDEGRDEVLWLKTGSENTDTVLEALAQPFGGQPDVASASARDKIRAVRTLLMEHTISLVVLDDVWDGAALNEVLRAVPRRVPVLVTARQRYALDDIIEIGRMDAEQALALLAHVARQSYDDDLADARELCRQLGYHAFALEVAAKTLKVDQIRPRDLLNRIAETPHDMTMPGEFAEEGRSSITELLDASLYALDERQRQTFLGFGRLSAPDVTVELLAQVLVEDADVVRESLITLQRRGLAERMHYGETGPDYFRIHNLAHSYARTIQNAQQRGAATTLEEMAAFVEAHAEDVADLDITRANWMGAAQAAHEQAAHEVLVRIMHPLVYDYLSTRGHTLPFLSMVDAAIEAAQTLGESSDEARHYLLSKRGNTYHQRGDIEGAIDCYKQALYLADKHDMHQRKVILLSVMASMYAEKKDETARTLLDEAYALADKMDDDFLRGYVLENKAYYAQSVGDYESTREFSTQQFKIAERIGDKTTQVFALLNMGTAENKLGQSQAALQRHQHMLEIARAEKNDIWTAHALQSLGEDYHALGQRDKARQHLQEARDLFEACGIEANVREIERFLQQEDYSA